LGKIYDKKTIKSAVIGNFALTQVIYLTYYLFSIGVFYSKSNQKLQSIVIGFLASFVACITEFIIAGVFHPKNLLSKNIYQKN
jgi:hypothetical protein